MIETLKNAWRIPELRKKLLFVVFALVIFVGVALVLRSYSVPPRHPVPPAAPPH